MNLQGQVVDANTGAALSKATISVDGVAMSTTDAYGNFNFNTPSDNVHEIEVSFVGYQTATLPADMSFNETGQIALTPGAAQTLQDVLVSAHPRMGLAKIAPYAAAGIGLLALTGKHKRGVRGLGAIDTNIILFGVLAIGAAYFLTKRSTAPPMPVYNPAAYPAAYAPPGTSSVAQDITAGGGAAASILNAISNF